jgi:hypothetical protein
MDEAGPTSLAQLQKLVGAGYNFYRLTDGQRADDLLVRARAADAISRATARVADATTAARRAIPPATRENPFPDPALLAQVAQCRILHARLGALETRLRGPAALPDRDFSHLRASPAHCERLVHLDAALLDAAEAPDLETNLDRLEATLDARAALAAWAPTAATPTGPTRE